MYPDFEELLEDFEHDKLLRVKVSFRSNISVLFLFFFAFFVVYLLNYAYYTNIGWLNQFPFLTYFSPRWLGIFPLLILLELFRRRDDSLYVIGPETVGHQSGRLSFSYKAPVVNYLDIRSITVRQDIFGRMLNYGAIDIDTPASDEVEISIRGVIDPRSLASLIEQVTEYNHYLIHLRREKSKTGKANGKANGQIPHSEGSEKRQSTSKLNLDVTHESHSKSGKTPEIPGIGEDKSERLGEDGGPI